MGLEDTAALLRANLLSPLVIAFLIGVIATLVRSELEFPAPVLNAISIYLVFSIGIKGGTELADAAWADIWRPVLATLALVVLVPVWCYMAVRRLGGFDIANAAAIAAHYGSASSVTFLASLTLARRLQTEPEPFLPVLASLMEWGILVAMFIARWQLARGGTGPTAPMRELVVDTLRGRSVILLGGGIVMGYVIGPEGFEPISPLFEDLFRGILVLFLLEMGMVAARQLGEFAKVGGFMTVFGLVAPLINGAIGVTLGWAVGLSPGGSFVFGSLAASASYIDAPAVVRALLPQANPSVYLTASLGITFPFNLTLGLPLYYKLATWLHGG